MDQKRPSKGGTSLRDGSDLVWTWRTNRMFVGGSDLGKEDSHGHGRGGRSVQDMANI